MSPAEKVLKWTSIVLVLVAISLAANAVFV